MSTNAYERQHAKYVMVDLGIANIGTGNGYTAAIPRGALIVSAGVITETAFNSATTTTATITDGTTALVSAVDVKTTGIETVAVAQKFYASGATIQFNLAETGAAATAGRAIGYVSYIQLGCMNSVQE